ncbi:MAG TPA: hypothetical protein VND95_00870 [Stellaceae bacterium]|nr:hypothetical protein [Stellaceae bacterium]
MRSRPAKPVVCARRSPVGRGIIGIGALQIRGGGGGRAVRIVGFLLVSALLAGLVSGCSDDKPPATSTQASQQALHKDCANPHWKEQNLGLWYSLCRQPLKW